MKKDKKIFSYKAIVICSLIISVFSTNAYAVQKGPPTKDEKQIACLLDRGDCEAGASDTCDKYSDNVFGRAMKGNCEALEKINCSVDYSRCMNSIRVGGDFNEQTLGEQDAYISPGTNNGGNRGPNTNTLVPQSGFVAPSPTNNGSTRTLEKTAAPMNKSLVVPLVVPTKKTSTMPTIIQPKMRTMSAPSIQPKQPATKYRVEKPVKHKVAKPASTHKNKKSTKQAAPSTSKGVAPKSNQPVMRNMNSAHAVNGSKLKAMSTSKNYFDEADAIFGKRAGMPNTQAR